MNATPRLLAVTQALSEAGLKVLIMGGHAVRYYGIDRNTFDFDFHISSASAADLESQLRRTRFFSRGEIKEGASWRRDDFRRFQIGLLPNGREEWLEFWLHNHLLGPFEELYERREEVEESGHRLCYLSLPDLIRSKETERDDDWTDARLLEEILDGRNLDAAAGSANSAIKLSRLRSRRGFEMAQARGLFSSQQDVHHALRDATHPVTSAYLLPFVPDADSRGLEPTVDAALRRVVPGSARHLAIVEAVRLAYQRAAKAADRRDKEMRRT